MTPDELEAAARDVEARFDPALPSPGGVPIWLGPEAHQWRGLGGFLDHTLLDPLATREQIIRLCEEGLTVGARTVCVNGGWVALAGSRLRGSAVRVTAVVGFPLGAGTPMAKFVETRLAVADGAGEIDMVVPLGRVMIGEWAAVEEDVHSVVSAADGTPVKAIIESAALDRGAIIRSSLVAKSAGARFVKTSTGFHPAGGASVEAVRLMRQTVGPDFGVKASGGIRSCAAAVRMLRAGANRLGSSSGLAMIDCLGRGAPTVGELFERES